jgi:hypothetical protein
MLPNETQTGGLPDSKNLLNSFGGVYESLYQYHRQK